MMTRRLSFPKVREPFLSISHALGIVIGFVALFVFAVSSMSDNVRFVASCIYCLSFITLFTASSVYHGVRVTDEKRLLTFEKIDYACIYLFIAGTYTPLCLVTVPGKVGVPLLLAEWAFALWGALSVMRHGFAHRYIQVPIFLVMGWSFLAAANSIIAGLSDLGIFYLFMGTTWYTLGALLFALGPPRFYHGRICSHGVWHVAVLLGAVSHSLMTAEIVMTTVA